MSAVSGVKDQDRSPVQRRGAETLSDLLQAGQGYPPPIFVVYAPGMPGETVTAMLGLHPQCYGLPEMGLELGTSIDQLLRTMTGVRSGQLHGLMRGLSQLLAGEQSIAGIDMARRWLMRHQHLPTAAAWRMVARRIAPRRLVAPVSAAIYEPSALARLATCFPEARFVLLSMHPKSHGQAVMAQHGGAAARVLGAVDEDVAPTMVEPAGLWLMTVEGQKGLADLCPAGAVVPLRVEDVAHDPARSMAHLAAQLGLGAEPEDLSAMMRPEQSHFRGPGPFGAHGGGAIMSLADLARTIPALDGLGLDGHAPWRDDGMPLPREVRAAAAAMGYR